VETERDRYFMHLALQEAEKAFALQEVPVGAVLVFEDRVIATGINRRETRKNALAHAEIEALNQGCIVRGGWRLSGCTLYVTLEPCPMCAGALYNARVDRIVYGCKDPNNGACGSVFNMEEVYYNHRVQVEGGVMEAEAAALMERFFRELRFRKKAQKEAEKKE